MGAWSKNANAGEAVTMLAVGNGAFADAVGLTMDGTAFGMGKRGQRFSMLVNAGVLAKLNVETPCEFKVSSVDHMPATHEQGVSPSPYVVAPSTLVRRTRHSHSTRWGH